MSTDGVNDRRQRSGCLMFFTEFRALLVKMLLLTKRRRAQTIAEIILAYLFLALLLAMRSLLDRTYQEPLQIPAFRPHDQMVSNGTRANMTYYYPRKRAIFFYLYSVLTRWWTASESMYDDHCDHCHEQLGSGCGWPSQQRCVRWMLRVWEIVFVFSERHSQFWHFVVAELDTGIAVCLRLFHQHRSVVQQPGDDARHRRVHASDARVSWRFLFLIVQHVWFAWRNGLRYYRAQQVKQSRSDILWKRAPEDFCQGMYGKRMRSIGIVFSFQ